MIVADGDLVIVHGRFSGFGAPVNWVAADILRIEDGVLVEHWDVIQDEATKSNPRAAGRCSATRFRSFKENAHDYPCRFDRWGQVGTRL